MKILQIVHKPEQIKGLDYPAVLNFPPTNPERDYLWMETNVIRKCLRDGMHKEQDYFGIVAPNYKEKIEACKNRTLDLRNKSKIEYRPALFHSFANNNKGADIISFTNYSPHSTFVHADKYHPSISKIGQKVCDAIGFRHNVKTKDPNVIYFNYWVATPQVCQAFHDEILKHLPSLSNMPELMRDANYKDFPSNLKKLYGIKHWTYHPFIGERLITIFATKHKLKVASF